jgi:hypothetical protein
MISANGACVKELARTNKKGKLFEREMKYSIRLLETDETNPLVGALG